MPEIPDNRSEEPQPPNRLRRLRQRLKNRPGGDTISAQIGENVRNVVVGKNVIQIGALQIPLALALLMAVGLVVIAISVGVLAFGRYFAKPVRMTGQFNIAVADFGELDADGHVRATDNGHVLSTWVYTTLKDEYAKNPDLGKLGEVQIWQDNPDIPGKNVKFGVIKGDTPEAREQAATALAAKVGAHMVIYGNVNPAAPAGLALEFYITPDLRPETSAIIGRYLLGRPIPVPLAGPTGGLLSNIAIGDNLKTRTSALFYLTAGLTFDLLGRSQDALQIFKQAETSLTTWQAEDGKEILYFFIGREALFLDDDKAAEIAARQALAIKPDYARAQLLLGGVFYRRSQRLPPANRLLQPSALEIAITNYEQGVAQAEQSQDLLVQSIARLALALALRTAGQTEYLNKNFAPANAAFDKATAMIQAVLPVLEGSQQYRLLGQAYLALGAAYFQQADIYRELNDKTAQKTHFEQAQAAFASCMAQGAKAPLDQILHEDVIAKNCQPRQADVEKALQQLEGGGT
ncbi:MAG: hypothetical protein NT075_07245 [Chloroflexi bacterium]|nr:hypothetical protein [Chloroflexota bacterium]